MATQAGTRPRTRAREGARSRQPEVLALAQERPHLRRDDDCGTLFARQAAQAAEIGRSGSRASAVRLRPRIRAREPALFRARVPRPGRHQPIVPGEESACRGAARYLAFARCGDANGPTRRGISRYGAALRAPIAAARSQ